MTNILRLWETRIWLMLVIATGMSWWMSTSLSPSPAMSHVQITLGVLTLTFIKVWLVMRSFMEINHAPLALRLIGDGWVLIVGSLVTLMYWAGATGLLVS